jgi:glycosyltransferase involved in cell wall biosynthesis
VSSSLRIVFLLNPFDLRVKGGAYVPQLARELLGRGHTVRGFGAPEGVVPRSAEEGDGESLSGLGGVVRFAPQVIVAYDALSPAALLGARASRRLSVPLVLVESGFSGSGTRLERFLRWVGQKLWGPFVRRQAQRIVALDPIAREQALREGFAEEQIVVLPAGVDLQRFRPGLSSGLVSRHRLRGRLLLYVGRLGAGRGLETLLQAFARSLAQGGHWSLVLAGEGSRQEKKELRALAARQGIGAHVHWLPLPRSEELPGLLGSASALVVPAVDDTVRGKQIPRALASGLPVIASGLPRLNSLVVDGETGLLVAPGDIGAWSEALLQVARSPEARKRWGAAARAMAVERLGWERIATSFEAELLRLLPAAADPDSLASETSPGTSDAPQPAEGDAARA